MMKFAALAGLIPHALAYVHDVQVGGPGGLVFEPYAIAANVGDQVVFHFHPKAHSVTQSSFANPCGLKEGGFDSGLMPVPENTTDHFPTWTLVVNDTAPIWSYCKAAGGTANSHCGKGMVFSINCGPDGSETSFETFRNAALKVGESLAANPPASTPAPSPSSPAPSGYGGGHPAPTDAPYPEPVTVTETVTLHESMWTTTYASYPNSPAPTPETLEGVEHKVIVGGPGKLLFDPENIVAKPRDTIIFEFHQKNHTATQSSWGTPCAAKEGGLDSGYQFVADGATDFPTWKVKVNGTEPLWFYCAQGNHCSASGMVFSVNTDEVGGVRTAAAFKSSAMSANVETNSTTGQTAEKPKTSDNGAMSMQTNGVVGLFVLAITFFFL